MSTKTTQFQERSDMQLQIDLPETLALQFCSHLDQSAQIIQAGLSQVHSQADKSQTSTIESEPSTDFSVTHLPIDDIPDFLDFLNDLEHRRIALRNVLSNRDK